MFLIPSLWGHVRPIVKAAAGKYFKNIKSTFEAVTSTVLNDVVFVLQRNYQQTNISNHAAKVSVKGEDNRIVGFEVLPLSALEGSMILRTKLAERLQKNPELDALKNDLKIPVTDWTGILSSYSDFIIKNRLKRAFRKMKKEKIEMSIYLIVDVKANEALLTKVGYKHTEVVVMHWPFRDETNSKTKRAWDRQKGKDYTNPYDGAMAD